MEVIYSNLNTIFVWALIGVTAMWLVIGLAILGKRILVRYIDIIDHDE